MGTHLKVLSESYPMNTDRVKIVFNPSNAEATFVQPQGRKDFENHLNTVVLAFIKKT